jgi:hypothetical protein
MSIVGDVLSGIDVQSMLLGITFVIILALLMLILGRIRTFQQNQGTKAIISICISLLAVYGILKSNWDIEGFFYNLGVGQDLLYNLVLIAVIAFFIITMVVKDEITGRRRFRLYRPMILLGLIFIGLRFTPMANGEGTLLVGIPLLIVGLLLWNRRRGQLRRYFRGKNMSPKEYLDYKYKLKKKMK